MINGKAQSAVIQALEILGYYCPPTIATIWNGGVRRAAIILPCTWEDVGICCYCGELTKDCKCDSTDPGERE